MTIAELHRKYFVLYEELKRAQDSSNMPSEQYDLMKSVLIHQYKQDIEDYYDDQLITYGMQRFERKFKVHAYIPRRFLFWWNPVAKKLLEQCKAEFLTYQKSLEKSTREEKQYAEELSCDSAVNKQVQQSNALTVLSETDVAPK